MVVTVRVVSHCRSGRRRTRAAPVSATAAPVSATARERRRLCEYQVCGVLGTQWGDEGKGKLVDIFASEYDIVARCQGGANAGHTIVDEEGNKYALHLLPSGVLNPRAMNVVGNGVVVNLPQLFRELESLEASGVPSLEGRLLVSDRAQILFDFHKEFDGMREAEREGKKIGTTKRGIGPAYATKMLRNGVRIGELRNLESLRDKLAALIDDGAQRFEGAGFVWSLDEEMERCAEYARRIAPYVADTVHYVNSSYRDGKRILLEGGQATLLDIDFGTYPYVTSSNPSAGGFCTGLGIAPSRIGNLVGVVKAYTTRVGEGPYPTELHNEDGERLGKQGFEFGTTTGRARRCGWLDVVALNYACEINGISQLNLTKLDVLSGFDEVKIGIAYKSKPGGSLLPAFPGDADVLANVEVVYETLPGWHEDISDVRDYGALPKNARAYVERIEQLTGLPCTYIGVGPSRDALIVKPS